MSQSYQMMRIKWCGFGEDKAKS